MSVPFRRRAPLFLMLLLSSAIGCGGWGPQRAEVQGKVTFEGVAIESGSIAFLPIEGTEGPSTGGEIRRGTYHLARDQGPVIGAHRVEIRATRKTGQQVASGEGADDATALVDEIEMFIPEKYNSQSTLTADVQPGTNQFNFDLKGVGN